MKQILLKNTMILLLSFGFLAFLPAQEIFLVEAGTDGISTALLDCQNGDIIELTTSGGMYIETGSDSIDVDVTIRAAAGLAAKPVVMGGGGTGNVFNVRTGGLNLKGIKFDGGAYVISVNAPNGFVPVDFSIRVNDCEFHNWTQRAIYTSGSSRVPLDSVLVKNTIFKDGVKQGFYLKRGDNADVFPGSYKVCHITNCLFTGLTSDSDGHATYIEPGDRSNGAQPWPEVVIDHVTVDNCPRGLSTYCTSGAIIKNSIVSNPTVIDRTAIDIQGGRWSTDPLPPPSKLINSIYVGGLNLTGSSTVTGVVENCDSAAVVYVDRANRDFRLADGSPGKNGATDGKDVGYLPPSEPSMDDFNLIKDGHFNTDGTIVPTSTLSPKWGGWSGNGGTAAVVSGVCTMTPGGASDQWNLQVNQVGNDNGWRTGNDSSFVLIFDAWAAADRVFAIDFEDNSGNGYKRYGLSPDPDAVNGESEWQVNLTTTNTTYTRVVKFNAVKANTTHKLNMMPSAKADVVYIDNIYLIYIPDLAGLGTAVTSVAVTGEGSATTITADKGTLQMSAEVLPADATIKNIAWSVTNGTGSATINSKGVLTATTNGTVTVKATSQDWIGVEGSLEVTISGQVVGVSNQAAKSVNVYPNPVVNELNVSLSTENATIEIYNSIGRKIQEIQVIGNQSRIDVSSYARGLYFIKINNDKVVKFVK